MKSLTLYRGIAVSETEVELVIQDIKTNGLYQNDKQQWGGFIWKNIKNEINSLYRKEDLTRDDTSPASVWIERKNGGHREYTEGEHILFFADKIGAEYYATKHNVNKDHKIPLLITLELDIENIAIDGRDFLYTVFGSIDPKKYSKNKKTNK